MSTLVLPYSNWNTNPIIYSISSIQWRIQGVAMVLPSERVPPPQLAMIDCAKEKITSSYVQWGLWYKLDSKNRWWSFLPWSSTEARLMFLSKLKPPLKISRSAIAIGRSLFCFLSFQLFFPTILFTSPIMLKIIPANIAIVVGFLIQEVSVLEILTALLE